MQLQPETLASFGAEGEAEPSCQLSAPQLTMTSGIVFRISHRLPSKLSFWIVLV